MNTILKRFLNKYDMPSIIFATGAVTSAAGGSVYASYQAMNEFKNHNLLETTAYTSFAAVYGGLLGVACWTISPVILTVSGAVYLHKKQNAKK